MLGVGRVCSGESRLASEVRKGFLRGVTTELRSEGTEDVNGGQTAAAACAKALGWTRKHVAFEQMKKGSLTEEKEQVRGASSRADFGGCMSFLGLKNKLPQTGGAIWKHHPHFHCVSSHPLPPMSLGVHIFSFHKDISHLGLATDPTLM